MLDFYEKTFYFIKRKILKKGYSIFNGYTIILAFIFTMILKYYYLFLLLTVFFTTIVFNLNILLVVYMWPLLMWINKIFKNTIKGFANAIDLLMLQSADYNLKERLNNSFEILKIDDTLLLNVLGTFKNSEKCYINMHFRFEKNIIGKWFIQPYYTVKGKPFYDLRKDNVEYYVLTNNIYDCSQLKTVNLHALLSFPIYDERNPIFNDFLNLFLLDMKKFENSFGTLELDIVIMPNIRKFSLEQKNTLN